jgi:hypothetical protein
MEHSLKLMINEFFDPVQLKFLCLPLSLAIDNNAQIVSLKIDCLLVTEISHLKISPGTSLNCTRISAFLESKALPAFMIKGTPAESRTMVLTNVQYQNSI